MLTESRTLSVADAADAALRDRTRSIQPSRARIVASGAVIEEVGVAERPSRQRPGRAMLSGQGLRAEAVLLVRAQPGYWTLRALSQYLARRHRLRPGLVRDLLEQGPELRQSPAQAPPPVRRPVTPAAARPVRSWDRVVEDVTLWLSEADTDAVDVEVAAGETARLVLRYDFVQAGPRVRIWLTGIARSPEVLESYLAANPWTLTAPGKLPLTGARADLAAPAVLVWRHVTAAAAALSLREVIGDTLGVAVDRVRVEAHQCTPVELERRLGDEATVRRLGRRTGRARATVSHCDRCGQPLSDPVSVQLGIGPECRRYYSTEVIRRLSRPGQPSPRPGSINEKEWLANVKSWLQDRTAA